MSTQDAPTEGKKHRLWKTVRRFLGLEAPPPLRIQDEEERERSGTLPPELIARIRAIQIKTSHLVEDIMAGEYVSAFKGRGMEFEEVREYQPGDDIRTIDWNVTARMGHPYVKTFREERELTVLLVVDISASGLFGSIDRTKNEVAATVAAMLAWSAIRSNDRVGLLLFTDRVERYIPPKKGRGHVWQVIREVLQHRARHVNTDMEAALHFLNKVNRKRSVCFIMSDFLDQSYQAPMRLTAASHDVIAVSITDPRELELPEIGMIRLADAETGETMVVDTSKADFQKRFQRVVQEMNREREDVFRSIGVDHIPIRTDQDPVGPLLAYFRRRERRR